jgi:hypothetical protein
VDNLFDSHVSVNVLVVFPENNRVYPRLGDRATEVMKERKRSTLSVEDLFSALNETDFGDFVEPLQQFLQEYKEQQSKKKEAKWEQKQAELGNHVAAQGTKPPGDDDYGMEEEPESGNVD